jgi:predicted dehydrogenase
MSRDIRIGVIGVGYLGKFHAQKFARIRGSCLVGVADIDEERGREVSREVGVDFYPHYEDLLSCVEAVSIAVPTSDHFRVARDSLKSGVDVFLEKPMCRTLEEADELIALAGAKGLLIQVGHLERFNPAIMALQKEINHPMFIESHRLGFFKERGVDVDVVLDLMIHDLDIILSLVKSEILSIHALGVPVMTPQVDIANARLVFENGCVANVTASRISMKTMRKIRIFQPNAYLSVDYAKRDLTVIKKVQDSEDTQRYQILPEYRQFSETDPLEEELTAFVHSVRERTEPLVDGAKGRRALKVSLEVMEQIASKLKEHNTLTQEEKTGVH